MAVSIPNIIHQIWIGPKPAPINMMNTWQEKNPEFTYMLWDEKRIRNEDAIFTCQSQIEKMEEWNGKADILRWEILYKYGGMFMDADLICVEAIDSNILSLHAFATYEQEKERPGLIATGGMGFPPKHPIVAAAVDFIRTNPVSNKETGKRAWLTVGPMLLTQLYNSGLQNTITILPSYTFLPQHYSGVTYLGHAKVYAHHEWGSTFDTYGSMNSGTKLLLPTHCQQPFSGVSILLTGLETTTETTVKQCLDSIKGQIGHFSIDVMWVGKYALDELLDNFLASSRFCTVTRCTSLHEGLRQCKYEMVFRMDSDCIMLPDRVEKQIGFMKAHSESIMCGAQVQTVLRATDTVLGVSAYTDLAFTLLGPASAANSTFCLRKSAVLALGNYDPTIMDDTAADFNVLGRVLEIRSTVHNMPDVVLLRRCDVRDEDANMSAIFSTYAHSCHFDKDAYIHPFSYGIPDELIVNAVPEKLQEFAPIIPGKIATYIYKVGQETDYYASYQRARFGYTSKKCGWDVLRHYEILANGCIPVMDFTGCPAETMAVFPKELITEANTALLPYTDEKNALYDTYVTKLLEHTRKYLSCSALAKSFLASMVQCAESVSVLIIRCDRHPNYSREMLTIGLKRLLGNGCTLYPPLPYLHSDYPFESLQSLYGMGYTYTRRLEPVITPCEQEIVEGLRTKRWSVVLFAKIGPDEGQEGTVPFAPLWSVVNTYYGRDEIAFLYGGDGCQDLTNFNRYADHVLQHAKHGHCFVRELAKDTIK